ncbi:hypothetical protein ACFPES_35640, partial [Paenibacillus sp. GCM10023248]
MCLTLPETLISVVGIEKIVPAWQDLEVFLQTLPRSSSPPLLSPLPPTTNAPVRPPSPRGVPGNAADAVVVPRSRLPPGHPADPRAQLCRCLPPAGVNVLEMTMRRTGDNRPGGRHAVPRCGRTCAGGRASAHHGRTPAPGEVLRVAALSV